MKKNQTMKEEIAKFLEENKIPEIPHDQIQDDYINIFLKENSQVIKEKIEKWNNLLEILGNNRIEEDERKRLEIYRLKLKVLRRMVNLSMKIDLPEMKLWKR